MTTPGLGSAIESMNESAGNNNRQSLKAATAAIDSANTAVFQSTVAPLKNVNQSRSQRKSQTNRFLNADGSSMQNRTTNFRSVLVSIADEQ